MPKKQKLSPGDWIAIGEQGLMKAVVAYDPSGNPNLDEKFIYCIYSDGNGRALYGELEWKQNFWVFSGRPGDYADNIKGFAKYINILKRGC